MNIENITLEQLNNFFHIVQQHIIKSLSLSNNITTERAHPFARFDCPLVTFEVAAKLICEAPLLEILEVIADFDKFHQRYGVTIAQMTAEIYSNKISEGF